MISQLSFLLNKTFKKSILDFLVIRTDPTFDIKLAQALNHHNLWYLSLNKEKWDHSIPRHNMVFINTLENLNIDYIITPHFHNALKILEPYSYIPKISIFNTIPPRKNNSKLEKKFSEFSLAPNQEVVNFWKLPKNSKVVNNWDIKILTQTIGQFCADSISKI